MLYWILIGLGLAAALAGFALMLITQRKEQKAWQTLLKEDLIDEWRISILPTLLGAGIALFGPMDRERKLRLTGVQTENGITELRYTRR